MAESVGQVIELWRYPVKSMLGEQLDAVEVNQRGLAGDRTYAVVDPAENRVGSAKIPRKWAALYGFRAAYADSAGLSNASTAAKRLKSTPLPSITGLPARGPMFPRPSTAVPFDTTATRLALAVYS